MTNDVFIKSYALPEVSFKEVRRYMRCAETDEINELIESCITEAASVIVSKVCYSVFDVDVCDSVAANELFVFRSDDLCKSIRGCHKLILFAATIGISYDRLVAKYSKICPSKAICLHALGSERIEALCDAFCADLALNPSFADACFTPRFSPGYGDLAIENQSVFESLLKLNKSIGISFNSSLLMTPSKSVTAIIGVRSKG